MTELEALAEHEYLTNLMRFLTGLGYGQIVEAMGDQMVYTRGKARLNKSALARKLEVSTNEITLVMNEINLLANIYDKYGVEMAQRAYRELPLRSRSKVHSWTQRNEARRIDTV